MSGNKWKPMVGLLTGSLVSGSKSGGLVEFATSPRSHKETTINTQSPKGPKNFDFGGVGLGIVAALEKSGDDRSKNPANKSLISRKLSRSNPIPVNSPKINSSRNRGELEDVETESLEDYTCHGPNKSNTKGYCNGIEGGRKGDNGTPFRIQNSTKNCVFHISQPRFGEVTGIPATDFLNSCNLCQKKLHGKDIYMYRGEKAFCSPECRYRQMVMDERKEKCRSEASRPAVDNISSSPYTNGGIFTAGILAI